MTFDLADRRLKGDQQHFSPSSKMATTTTARFPLQSHYHGGFESTPAVSETYASTNGRVLHRLSTLESSNNDNNTARIASFSQRGQQSEKDSSTLAQVNAPTGSAPGSLSKRSESVGRGDRGRSKSTQGGSTPRSASQAPCSKTADDGHNSDNENVIIEEKRRRVNGEGYTVHRYLRGRLLGRGGFAKVYLCTALDTSKNYAVKIVTKANLVKARARQKLQAEIKIHRTLKHKNVCEYKHFFEDRNNCYILLELCHNQSLNEMIKRRKRLTEPEAAMFMRQLLEAVHYLHGNCVIHRDLKLGNLFLDRNLSIKVGDFGLATRLEHADEKRKTICGTPNYIAPEVIQGDKASRGHSFEVDIWSMGVILFTILVGKPPYEAKDVKATYQRIIANEYSFPSHVNVSETAKDLIVSMLQSKPEDRPSLDDIAAHPLLAEHNLPSSLPPNATHVAPEWSTNDQGELVTNQTTEDRFAPSKSSKKPALPAGRRPLGQRDPNVEGTENGTDRILKGKSERDVINIQGLVRNTLGGGSTSMANNNKRATSVIPGHSPFHIYDESKTPKAALASMASPESNSPPSSTDDLVAQTNALSLRNSGRKNSEVPRPDYGRTQSIVSSVPSNVGSATGSALTAINSDNDANILHQMLGNLETVMEITQSRKGKYYATSPRPAFRGGPSKWVTRYVDYTSKYGLGFLLNDGSSGVYFNDSTKTVLESDGQTFQYIERRKLEDVSESPRNREALVATYTLSSHPEDLQKKVTLLKHFHNYLVEQQKKLEGDGFIAPEDNCGTDSSFVFIKKWVRTKHAILFRLSNQTVQIVFYDQTEILLTPDERYITYVDKQRYRQTFHFNDELIGNNPDFAKRLKYTKEIMQQLITGQRR